MDIVRATRAYETWMASHTQLVRADLRRKHERMRESPFVFFRGTFYRWMQHWAALGPALTGAPPVLAVGDLHVENFGTWRDAEGRLIWGVNDVDEACVLPFTSDLVRLAASAWLAVRQGHFALSTREACDAILEGYTTAIAHGARPFVLGERHRWLRDVARSALRDPQIFWSRLRSMPIAHEAAPHDALRSTLPDRTLTYRVHHRVAGVGSLGRQRFVAIAEWCGGTIAREAKAILPSAAVWAGIATARQGARHLLAQSIRAADPCFRIRKPWQVRRLAPDCSRIELAELPKKRDELRLLRAMGWETANMHAGPSQRSAIGRDLAGRKPRWLEHCAGDMVDATIDDWRRWTVLKV